MALAALLTGWLAFVLGTLLFSSLAIALGPALALACASFALGLLLLPRPRAALAEGAPAPGWDLPLRAGCALALVLALTAVAGWLGPQLSGLLAPFPIIASVLATFTHTQRGVDEARRLLRGLLSGFGAFALFCFTLALALPAMSVAAAFALASGAALLAQGVLLRQALRAPGASLAGARRVLRRGPYAPAARAAERRSLSRGRWPAGTSGRRFRRTPCRSRPRHSSAGWRGSSAVR